MAPLSWPNWVGGLVETLWIAVIALSISCFALGAISLKRGRRISAGLLIVTGLLILVVPLPPIQLKVELLPARSR